MSLDRYKKIKSLRDKYSKSKTTQLKPPVLPEQESRPNKQEITKQPAKLEQAHKPNSRTPYDDANVIHGRGRRHPPQPENENRPDWSATQTHKPIKDPPKVNQEPNFIPARAQPTPPKLDKQPAPMSHDILQAIQEISGSGDITARQLEEFQESSRFGNRDTWDENRGSRGGPVYAGNLNLALNRLVERGFLTRSKIRNQRNRMVDSWKLSPKGLAVVLPPNISPDVDRLVGAMKAGADVGYALHDALLEARRPDLAEMFQ